jgi:hypothetical protein
VVVSYEQDPARIAPGFRNGRRSERVPGGHRRAGICVLPLKAASSSRQLLPCVRAMKMLFEVAVRSRP